MRNEAKEANEVMRDFVLDELDSYISWVGLGAGLGGWRLVSSRYR